MKTHRLISKPQSTDSGKKENFQQWDAYFIKKKEFNPNESLWLDPIRNIHVLQEQALWFANNTPIPFKTHYPVIDCLASLSARYLCELARRGNDKALREAGRIAIQMCELLDELLHGESAAVDEHAGVLQPLAEGLPYWPMLHFKHRQAVNHFQRVADKLHLGEKCWLNVHDRANYSLQTPVNRLAWRCIRHFQEIHDILEERLRQDKPPARSVTEALTHYIFNDRGQGMIHAEEIPVYEASQRLKKLTKTTAREWVDVAFMPWIKIREPDLRKLPGFKGVNTGPRGRRYAPARRKLIEAVTGLAPEA